VYTLPNFNAIADAWVYPNTPAGGPPDYILISCQMYMFSKAPVGPNPVGPPLQIPPIYFRLDPLGAPYDPGIWILSTTDPVSARPLYFIVVHKEWMHFGFPNQYPSWLCTQSDTNGNYVPRDIAWY
jgi:hypothetical protein